MGRIPWTSVTSRAADRPVGGQSCSWRRGRAHETYGLRRGAPSLPPGAPLPRRQSAANRSRPSRVLVCPQRRAPAATNAARRYQLRPPASSCPTTRYPAAGFLILRGRETAFAYRHPLEFQSIMGLKHPRPILGPPLPPVTRRRSSLVPSPVDHVRRAIDQGRPRARSHSPFSSHSPSMIHLDLARRILDVLG